MSKEKQIEIKSITYEEERLYFFVDQVSLAQKKYDRLYKTFKDAPYLSEGARFLSDAGRELQFYKDVVKMLDKGYRKQSEVAREIFEEIEKTIRGALVIVGFSYKHNPKEIQCKKECYEDFLGYIAELKKKYTEDKK